MHDYQELLSAAFHTERVRSRLLAKRSAISEEAALWQTLEQVAGAQGLPALLAQRRRAQEQERERIAAKAAAKSERLAQQRAARAGSATAMPATWKGWFDGSAHPNPGRLGIGALLVGPDGERTEISRRAGMGDSGEAEYAALIALLEAAVAQRPAQLCIYGDSQVVINDVLRVDLTGAKGLEQQRRTARALLALLPDVTLVWIPRHRNGAADALSQQAIAAASQQDEMIAASTSGG